jgi:hypothetical protein
MADNHPSYVYTYINLRSETSYKAATQYQLYGIPIFSSCSIFNQWRNSLFARSLDSVHKIQQFVSRVRHVNPLLTFTAYFSKINFNITTHLSLALQCFRFPWLLYDHNFVFISSFPYAYYMPRPSHHSCHGKDDTPRQGEMCKLWSCSLCNVPLSSFFLFSYRSSYCPHDMSLKSLPSPKGASFILTQRMRSNILHLSYYTVLVLNKDTLDILQLNDDVYFWPTLGSILSSESEGFICPHLLLSKGTWNWI